MHNERSAPSDAEPNPRDQADQSLLRWTEKSIEHWNASCRVKPRGYRSDLWVFIRHQRGCPELIDLDEDDSWDRVNSAVRMLGSGKENPWFELFGVSEPDAQIEWLDAWPKVEHFGGLRPLEAAKTLADKYPLQPIAKLRTNDDYVRFLSLAGWLQVLNFPAPILLPVRLVAETLGGSWNHMTASRYSQRARMEKHRYLELTSEHVFRGKGDSEAAEYRFDLDRFPALKAVAGQSIRELMDGSPDGCDGLRERPEGPSTQ